MKKSLSLILAAMMLLSALAGCGSEPAPAPAPAPSETPSSEAAPEAKPTAAGSKYVVWNGGSEAKTWDPNISDEDFSDQLSVQLFEGLTTRSPEGALPGVAETWESTPDSKNWTFHLRKDAKWSDGSPVTAHDFVYAWLRSCDPKSASNSSTAVTDYVVGAKEMFDGGPREDVKISAPDDYTFEVELKMGVPFFPDLVTGYTYCPVKKEAVETGDGWEKRPETAISNGPFVLEEYQLGSHMLLKKNENYWDAANVELPGIKVVFIKDANTALQGFEAGDIQVNKSIPSNELVRLIAENPNLRNNLQPGTYYIGFNMDKPPVDDVRVRKALTLAIDRKAIVEQITRGGQLPANAFLPTGLAKSDGVSSFRTLDENGYPVKENFIDPLKADVETAQALLAEAGYPNGEGFPEIELLYNTSENHKKIMEAVQSMWKKNLNINVNLRNEEWQVFLSTKDKGDYYMCRAGWIGNSFDASGMLKQFQSHSGSNSYQWRYREEPNAPHDTKLNPDQKVFEDLYQKAMNSVGEERDAGWVAAEEALLEALPICPIYFYTNPILIDEEVVEGIELSKSGEPIFKNARLVG